MTCAKKRVSCHLYFDDRMFISVGYNDVDTPQEVCPRDKGEGYHKCKTVCGQQSHAEVAAIQNAADNMHYAEHYHTLVAKVSGIDWVCRDCQLALQDFARCHGLELLIGFEED